MRSLNRYLKCIQIAKMTETNIDSLRLLIYKCIEICCKSNVDITKEIKNLNNITINEKFIIR
jgi:hypothetical protein